VTAHAVLTATVPGRPGAVGSALRPATAEDAPAIHALIARYQAAGRLLPRSEDEIARHADRFLVVTTPAFAGGGRFGEVPGDVMGCAELAPLSATVAEVRSLVVDEQARGLGFGRLLVDAIADEARHAGFRSVCAFTHDPAYFVRLGYSLVPHAWLPAKIAHDCAGCALFRQCGQDAVRLQLAELGPRA
jgi:amino-acid N-acetyltransferase